MARHLHVTAYSSTMSRTTRVTLNITRYSLIRISIINPQHSEIVILFIVIPPYHQYSNPQLT